MPNAVLLEKVSNYKSKLKTSKIVYIKALYLLNCDMFIPVTNQICSAYNITFLSA